MTHSGPQRTVLVAMDDTEVHSTSLYQVFATPKRHVFTALSIQIYTNAYKICHRRLHG